MLISFVSRWANNLEKILQTKSERTIPHNANPEYYLTVVKDSCSWWLVWLTRWSTMYKSGISSSKLPLQTTHLRSWVVCILQPKYTQNLWPNGITDGLLGCQRCCWVYLEASGQLWWFVLLAENMMDSSSDLKVSWDTTCHLLQSRLKIDFSDAPSFSPSPLHTLIVVQK